MIPDFMVFAMDTLLPNSYFFASLPLAMHLTSAPVLGVKVQKLNHYPLMRLMIDKKELSSLRIITFNAEHIDIQHI
jgi:hypothetical protein